MWPAFNFWPPIVSLESVKLGTANAMYWLTQTSTKCAHDKITSESVFRVRWPRKFWEIHHNISETVQDRHHYRWHIVTLKVTFAVFTFIDVFLRCVPRRHDSVFNSSVKKRPYFDWHNAWRHSSAVAELLVGDIKFMCKGSPLVKDSAPPRHRNVGVIYSLQPSSFTAW